MSIEDRRSNRPIEIALPPGAGEEAPPATAPTCPFKGMVQRQVPVKHPLSGQVTVQFQVFTPHCEPTCRLWDATAQDCVVAMAAKSVMGAIAALAPRPAT